MTTERASGGDTASVVRVATREVVDVAYRAMRVAGASSGEAQHAARVVLHAELVGIDGLALLLDELPTVSRDRVAGRLHIAAGVATIDDPAGRGLLYSVTAAVEACLAIDPHRPILVPGAAWRAAVDSIIAVSARSATHTVHAAQLDREQQPIAGEVSAARPVATGLPGGLPAGLVVWAIRAAPLRARIDRPPAERQRYVAAARTGVCVDRQQWARAESAAHSYLVPEPQ